MSKQQAIHKVVVLGAGESGIGAALLARKMGIAVFVSDAGPISSGSRQMLEAAGIAYEEQGHSAVLRDQPDCVIKSPGIPGEAGVIQAFRKGKIPVISEIEWAFKFKGDSKIIGVTGSNGKTTTAHLIYFLLKQAGRDVALVGNVGTSFAGQIAERPAEWYVVEISSFQLDDIESFRPDIGIILNIIPDHLDRYNYDFDRYAEAKFRMAKNQTAEDLLIVNVDDPTIKQYLTYHKLIPKLATFTMKDGHINPDEGAFIDKQEMHIHLNEEDMKLSIQDLNLKGKHNQYNSMAAGISARAAGIRKETIRECFSAFEGLEHRLEFVATIRGVDFINDSKGTNLNSVWFALESMKKPVVLILGGQDKGNDYNEILELVQDRVRAIVCMGKDNTPLLDFFNGVVEHLVSTSSAKDAVNAAYALAESGDVVLLSPGCASFDLFRNFEDRGEQFKQAVRAL